MIYPFEETNLTDEIDDIEILYNPISKTYEYIGDYPEQIDDFVDYEAKYLISLAKEQRR